MKKLSGVFVAVCVLSMTAPAVQASGETVYQTCVECHGADVSLSAMGKSQVIKGWPAARIVEAINGYKAGTYGGPLKALMKVQADKLDDASIQAVAEYISGL